MGNLLRIAFKKPPADDEPFPFSVPTIRSLPALDLSAPVTFFVGENGTGKSTLLEGIAAAAELPAVGGEEVGADDSLAPQRRLGAALRLSWVTRSKRGLFLRAEDFFGHIKRNARIDARIARESGEFGAAQGRLARGESGEVQPVDQNQVRTGPGALHTDERDAARYLSRYDARSHGESFMDLFAIRVKPGGLYLLDEPEAPLSPKRQLEFLTLLLRATATGAQFIIATHSPMLLAFPGARIYCFDSAPVTEERYQDLGNVRLMREFLKDPSAFLADLA
jgi:predicted ATPase